MYDFDLDKTATPKEMAKAVKEYGLCRIESAIDNVEELKVEVLNFIKQFDSSGYEFGKASRAKIEDVNNNYPNLHKLFTQKFMKDCSREYLNSNFKLNEWIFATHDYKNEGKLARNGFLHFDRLYCFKFFYYLTDVDKNCGPFSCIPKTHIKGKELRINTHKTTNDYSKLKNRIFLDHPELGYKQDDIIPIFGKKGTLIIFDTDTFHMGGVTNGKERLIVRGHTKLI